MTALLATLALLLAADPAPDPAALADTALAAAEKAVAEAKATGVSAPTLDEAHKALARAKAARGEGNLDLARREADAAWALVQEAKKAAPEHTKFRVAVDDEEVTRVAVDRGAVVVDSGTESAPVGSGKSATVGKEKKIAVAALPAAPALAEPREGGQAPWKIPADDPQARLVEIPFSWSPVEGAAGYELVLARDPTFRQVVARVVAKEPRGLLRQALPVGSYFWRVRSRSVAGALGPHSEARQLQVTEKAPSLEVKGPVWK
jgi:hypothetical protein